MVATTAAVISTISKTVELHVKYSTTTEHNPPEANYYWSRGNGVPKNGYHHTNKHYL
jgi:hypothetical protein